MKKRAYDDLKDLLYEMKINVRFGASFVLMREFNGLHWQSK